jgi:hypothetical protein
MSEIITEDEILWFRFMAGETERHIIWRYGCKNLIWQVSAWATSPLTQDPGCLRKRWQITIYKEIRLQEHDNVKGRSRRQTRKLASLRISFEDIEHRWAGACMMSGIESDLQWRYTSQNDLWPEYISWQSQEAQTITSLGTWKEQISKVR